MQEFLKVRGARTNNLKNVDVDIPKNTLSVITGLSGSGKSSLAFDTIYAEGQRRYVESLSAYARQFLGLMDKPDVDLIEGLSPAISIDQKSTGHSPRSTVGTVTEIYDYLRLLFARVGHPRSPITGRRLEKQTVQQIVDSILKLPENIGEEETKILILAPVVKNRKGTYEELFSRFLSQGYVRVRVDGQIFNLEEDIKLDKFVKHNIELVVDRLVIKTKSFDSLPAGRHGAQDDKTKKSLNKEKSEGEEVVKRITDSIELALNLGDGEILVNVVNLTPNPSPAGEGKKKAGAVTPCLPAGRSPRLQQNIRTNGDIFYSEKLVDPETGDSFPEIEPHTFSFNSPFGACPECNGLGNIKEIDPRMVYNPRLTIMEGGIYPWNRVIENENSYMLNLLEEVAKKHKFSLRTPIGELDPKHLQIVLYGTGEGEKYQIKYTNSEGRVNQWNAKFEGVIPNLMRRYKETESEYIRSEIEQYMQEKACPTCRGYRLKKEALGVTILGKNIVDVGNMSIKEAHDYIESLENNNSKSKILYKNGSVIEELFGIKNIQPEEDAPTNQELEIGKQIFKEIKMRLNFLIAVGLNYLTLNRTARTLSGGEAQRIRLASQIGTGLSGVLYVLDEPSIGLHQRDNERLINTLVNLRDLGNTVLVVEHDEDTIKRADYIVDVGPGAGEAGGHIVFQGKVEELLKHSTEGAVPEPRLQHQTSNLPSRQAGVEHLTSLTGEYLSGKRKISKDDIYKELKNIKSVTHKRSSIDNSKNAILFTNIKHNNLKGIDLEIPLGKFVCVTGVSGSGKSSMINDVMYRAIAKHLYGSKDMPGEYNEMRGIENIDKVIDIDQSPIGRTPRSNPVTYTGVFNFIREMFAQTKEAKARGYKSGRFSFNVKGGRCEKCQGAGVIQISMQFLPDVYVKCEECDGKRYNRETLQIDYKGKNIYEVLDMTVSEATEFFKNINQIHGKFQTLMDVGLGYIRLGQAATTLSGGESQRVKLATELSKKSTGKTLYILDEPTTGLHFEDVRKLLVVLHGLVAKGNSVVVIEHNLDLIKTADWIIDMGPEGGEEGGTIMAEGTPEQIAKVKESYTGQWLSKIINE